MSLPRSNLRPFSFLALPGEVRNMIYPLLLVDHNRHAFPGARKALHPCILAANRQTNSEGTPILYGKNAFCAYIGADIINSTGSPSMIPASRHLKLTSNWRIVIGLADPASSWGEKETWEQSLGEARERVCMVKKSLGAACMVLSDVPELVSVQIHVDSDFHWSMRERWAGVGLRELLDMFKNLRGVKNAEILGVGCIIPAERVKLVREAMQNQSVL